MDSKKELIEKLEPFLAKLKEVEVLLNELKKEEDKPKVDFSILNDEDVFYLKTKSGYRYLFIGRDPINTSVAIYSYIQNEKRYNAICNKESILELRKATDEEIALYRKYYPVKQKVWIEIYKNKFDIILSATHTTEELLDYSLKYNPNNDMELLEVIEREY